MVVQPRSDQGQPVWDLPADRHRLLRLHSQVLRAWRSPVHLQPRCKHRAVHHQWLGSHGLHGVEQRQQVLHVAQGPQGLPLQWSGLPHRNRHRHIPRPAAADLHLQQQQPGHTDHQRRGSGGHLHLHGHGTHAGGGHGRQDLELHLHGNPDPHDRDGAPCRLLRGPAKVSLRERGKLSVAHRGIGLEQRRLVLVSLQQLQLRHLRSRHPQ